MPWRGVGDAYRVWISEIMLQQTTVAAVIPYYERFLARFPTLKSLAEADEQEVLSAWEGLGYYSRGRNLHRSARVVMADHGGEFPKSVDELRELPGIGRYTAGAIASFAFDVSAPILEANTLRLYARLMGYAADPRSTEGQATLWRFAEEIVPARQAGAFNQGVIDLGALVCTPVDPQCSECPLMNVCVSFQTGRQNQIPIPKARPAMTEVHEAAIAIRRGNRWLVRQRPGDERWAGMWDFPRLPLEKPISRGNGRAGAMTDGLYQSTGLKTNLVSMLPEFTHSVTRYRIRLTRRVVDYVSGEWSQTAEHRWLSLEELVELPMPMAARRFVTDLAAPGWDPEGVLELSRGGRGRGRGGKK